MEATLKSALGFKKSWVDASDRMVPGTFIYLQTLHTDERGTHISVPSISLAEIEHVLGKPPMEWAVTVPLVGVFLGSDPPQD